MLKTDIKQIILDQKEELRNFTEKQRLIDREVMVVYKKYMKSGLIKVITGIRRCGKSVLSFKLLEGKKFAYVNFDDERLATIRTENLNDVLESCYEVYGELKYIFLDEVQNIAGWELFANRLQRQGLNVVITGSNAKLLSKELATHLTGRHLALELYPFSFREFLAYAEIKPDAYILSTKDKGLLKNRLRDYIKDGGFPELLKKDIDAKVYLKALYSTIIDKDVVLRNKIKHIKTLKEISNYMVSNVTSQVSFNKIKNIFGIKSIHTALNYLSFLEESYLFYFLKRISYKYRESLVANRKAYVIDTGFIDAVSIRFTKDIGKLYENIVLIELLRRKELENAEIYYWQNIYKHEVDFVVKKGIKIVKLIQVCYDISNYDTKKREIRSLIAAAKELRCRNLLIITEDYESEEKIGNKKIRYMPLWRWLLE